MLRGDEQSGLGWYSPVYGQLAELTTVRVTHTGSAPFWMAGVFDLSGRNSIDRVEWMAVSSAAGKPADTAALRIYRAGSVDYVLFGGTGGSAARDGECRRIGSSDARHAGELETDARMLFYRVDDGHRVVRFALVDGCLFRRTAGHVYLALPRQAPDVHVDLESCAA